MGDHPDGAGNGPALDAAPVPTYPCARPVLRLDVALDRYVAALIQTYDGRSTDFDPYGAFGLGVLQAAGRLWRAGRDHGGDVLCAVEQLVRTGGRRTGE